MKFNVFRKAKQAIKNYEGAEAFALNERTELYSAVVTTSLSDKFYESADKRMGSNPWSYPEE